MTFELDLGNLIVRRKEKSMFNFLVTAEGGLTTAGYAVSVIAVLILIILVASITSEKHICIKIYHTAAGYLCSSIGTCICNFLH